MGYIVVMKVTREEREMLELAGLFVVAVMAVPVAVFALVMMLSLWITFLKNRLTNPWNCGIL